MAEKPGIYDGVSLQGMGSVVKEALSPTDKQFAEMERQGHAMRDAISFPSGGWGIGVSKPQIYQQPTAVTQPNQPLPSRQPTPYAELPQASYSHEGNARPPIVMPQQPQGAQAPMRGVQVTNTYDIDRPASMGAAGNNPWQDMARQLATFSNMRMERDANYANQLAREQAPREMHPEERRIAESNAMLSRWGGDYKPQQALDARLIQDRKIQGEMTQAGIRERGALAQEGLRGRNQLAAEDVRGGHLMGAERLRGDNAYEREGLQGRYGNERQELANQGLLAVQNAKVNDPSTAAAMENHKAQAALYGERATTERENREQLKLPMTQYSTAIKEADAYEASTGDTKGAQQRRKAAQDRLDYAEFQAYKAKNSKANGGLIGYAEGGQVESPEQLMARMAAKYGTGSGTPQVQAPAPTQQAPAPQPAPQQKPQGGMLGSAIQGLMGRRKAIDAAAGYADGGVIDSSPQFQTRTSAELAQDATNKQATDRTNYDAGIRAIGAASGQGVAQQGGAAMPQASGPSAPYVPGGAGDPKATFSSPSVGVSRGASYAPGRTPAPRFDDSQFQFAEGGMIDVGGRLLDGAGTGKSDSLPAMIDGEHPAALSKGEFVMPVEAVQHFGLDRLNKMVAAARKGLDTGRQQG